METFNWPPREGMQVSTKPAVTVVKFGDGYEQRRTIGLNAQLKSYSPVFRVQGYDQQAALESFLSVHAGKAFLWRSPLTQVVIKVVCREWDVTMNAPYVDFSCKFEEVVA
ncbi:phage tail protein [Salmonella enterica]|nr:phage tail protein [Salmonella enterica]EBA9765553.1 phage tail protein [Salmonella enterica]EEB5699306.1 phage tail protein [Salmonella enterica]EGX5144510.1 phage tail protein [Salmonella enterica]ELF4900217.1 phage tail protein [Salmonella enterica]